MQTYKTYLRIPSALVVARSNSQGIFVFKITMEKKCTKCKEVKDFDEFSKDKRNKDGKQSRCKSCQKEYNIKNKDKNKDKRKAPTEEQKERRKKHRQENKEFFKKKDREYYQKNKHIRQKYRKDNKERLLKYTHEYYQNNKKKIRILRDKWSKENKEKINKYRKLKYDTNTLYKLRVSIRSNIAMSIKKQGYTKKTKTYNMLKCDYNFFMQWLNGIASNGYQYGFGNLELDHVVPISLAETEDEAILLSHYSNYQLLSADENLEKSNRYVNPTNLKRVLEHHPNPDKIREIHARL